MEVTDTRALIARLADDFSKLEEHARHRQQTTAELGRIRLAAAIVRNSVGPFLNDQPAKPLHIAVVGGAGTGKSTIVNFLLGAVVAEANPQAGFTRHPVAYVTGNEPLTWCSQPGLLGKLQRLVNPSPSSLDEDVYQVRRIQRPTHSPAPATTAAAPATAASPAATTAAPLPSTKAEPLSSAAPMLEDFVVWDCPDMTTWAAVNYVSRLLEVAGLADIIVYVASDERYNDEVPTQFLRLLLEAGKPVVIVLTKMRPSEVEPLLAHFRQEVLGRIAADNPKLPRMAALLAVPHLKPEELADPLGRAASYRIPIINQIKVIAEPPESARKRVIRSSTHFLRTQGESLLQAARNDLRAVEGWCQAVQAGQDEFIDRLQREHLATKKFPRFDEAMERLMESLELPGPGKLISGLFWLLRTPYTVARSLLARIMARPEGLQLPEREVLDAGFQAWIDRLRATALRQANTHPIWQHIHQGFEANLAEETRQKFQDQLRAYERQVASEVDRVAQGVYLDLDKNPALLNTLRVLKLSLDLSATLIALFGFGGINEWDLLLVPLAAALSHQLFELVCRGYIIGKREQTRARQLSLAAQYISAPLAEFLNKWPATGGSLFEQLQRAVGRIPGDIGRLERAVSDKLTQSPAPPKPTTAPVTG
jgi:GTP-binding protein EngB required for normal cell division